MSALRRQQLSNRASMDDSLTHKSTSNYLNLLLIEKPKDIHTSSDHLSLNSLSLTLLAKYLSQTLYNIERLSQTIQWVLLIRHTHCRPEAIHFDYISGFDVLLLTRDRAIVLSSTVHLATSLFHQASLNSQPLSLRGSYIVPGT